MVSVVNIMQLTDREFQLISSLVNKICGITLGEKKRSLVAARLQKVLLSGGFGSFQEYYEYIIQDTSGEALLNLVDQISTNHTYFFREKEHFDFLINIALPEISKGQRNNGRRKVRIWSAGCSSGEEPYTLAMILKEYLGDNALYMDAGILATDISFSVLETAMAGIYPADKMLQVPISYRQRYFSLLKDGNWAVKQCLKDMVLFRRLNLMSREFRFKGLFQVIFCRNVMIYFDKATRWELIEKFHRYTEPGGYLLIGHSETLDREAGLYKYIKPSIYKKI
ncbi:MAG TPA: chemotaxis protein CheR [Pelotomaculum sp.]|nr:chemotaxis protein CheR [Pelotomaculum sp.]